MIHVPENVRRFLVDHRVVYQREQAGRDRGPGFGDRAWDPSRSHTLGRTQSIPGRALQSGLLRYVAPHRM